MLPLIKEEFAWFSGTMKLIHVIITLFSCVTHVIGEFQCQGTCYSGSFPKNHQVIKGKCVRGYSYKNITTDVPHNCFSSCINDCRCKAFQIKHVRCELLDEDKTSKAADFVAETGYVYYDLQQTFYKGKSHMVHGPGVCYNGCCRTQPCMNGGTCVEHCENPKHKFSCKCPNTHCGRVCERKIHHSCNDVLKSSVPGITPSNGTYTITRSDTNTSVPVYCAFDTPNQAWTLIESFSLANNELFKDKALFQDSRRNHLSPNWNDYRLSLSNMQYIQTNATMFRATCDYPNRNSLTPDFLLGLLKELNITSSDTFSGHCQKYLHANIRGKECFNCTVNSYKVNTEHFHIDTTLSTTCNLPAPGDVNGADNFGFYESTDKKFKCTATQQSTTQWWLGEQL